MDWAFGYLSDTLCSTPPGRAADSPQEASAFRRIGKKKNPARIKFDQNFDRFLTSIFGRFGVVLGCQVGVILGTFGGQDRPRSVQNASWKPINIKNVIFHQTLARVYGSAYLEPKMASKTVQDRPKTAPRGS